MKKIFALVLCLIMVLSCCLVGCTNTDTSTAAITTTTETEPPKEKIETILIDNEVALVKLTSTPYEDSMWDEVLIDIYIENKTDRTIMFGVEEVSVNSYMIDPFWATEIAGGKKENTQIYWSKTELLEQNIEKIENLEFILHAHDNETWEQVFEDVYCTIDFA